MAKLAAYGVSDAIAPSSSAGLVDGLEIPYTAKPDTNYAAIASLLLSAVNTSGEVQCYPVHSGDPEATTFQIHDAVPKDASDIISIPAASFWNSGPGGSFAARQRYGGRNGNTGAARSQRIAILELDPEDQGAFTTTDQTFTGDTNWHTAQTLSFTPASAGDYLVFATGFVAPSNGANPAVHMGFQLVVDGQFIVTQEKVPPEPGDVHACGFFKLVNLTAAPHTLEIQVKSFDLANGVVAGKPCLLALRVDALPDGQVFYAESSVLNTTVTFPDFVDASEPQLDADIQGDALVLASAIFASNSISSSAFVRLSGEVNHHEEESAAASIASLAYFTLRKETLQAPSHYTFQFRSDSGNTTRLYDRALVAIPLQASSPPVSFTALPGGLSVGLALGEEGNTAGVGQSLVGLPIGALALSSPFIDIESTEAQGVLSVDLKVEF